MSEKFKMAMDAALAGGRSKDEAEAYLFAVEAFRDTTIGLKGAGIGPNECCDALGYALINLLTDHYSEEHAMLSLETRQSTLKQCYEAGLGPSPKSTTSVSPH